MSYDYADERAEYWWVRCGDCTEPAEVHFRDDEPVRAWLTGESNPVEFPGFTLVARILLPRDMVSG